MCGAGGRAVKAGPSVRRSSMDRAPQNTLGTAPVGRNTDGARHAGRQHIGFVNSLTQCSGTCTFSKKKTPTLHVAAP